MKVLILEGYNTHIKFSVYAQDTSERCAYGDVDNIGVSKARITVFVREEGRISKHVEIGEFLDLSFGLEKILRMLQDEHIRVIDDRREIFAVGFKLSHGGTYFPEAVEVTSDVRRQLKKLIPLAPEYLKPQIKLLNAGRRLLSKSFHVAMFDTSFHLTIPQEAYYYGIPQKYNRTGQVRKHGAHGLAHESMMRKASKVMQIETEEINLISIYLENSCSIAAIKSGKSIDCTTGLSPMSGISAGSYAGDIDPMVIDYLIKEEGLKPKELYDTLKFAGGFTTTTSKYLLEDVLHEANRDMKQVAFALAKLAYDIRKQIGAYMAATRNIHAITVSKSFEHGHILRRMIFSDLDHLGISYDPDAEAGELHDVNFISSPTSRIPLLHVEQDEHERIAQEIIHAVNMSIAN